MRIPDGEVLFRSALIDLLLMTMFSSYNGIFNGRRQFGVLAGAHLLYGTLKLVALVGLGFFALPIPKHQGTCRRVIAPMFLQGPMFLNGMALFGRR